MPFTPLASPCLVRFGYSPFRGEVKLATKLQEGPRRKALSTGFDVSTIVLSESVFCDDVVAVCAQSVPRPFTRHLIGILSHLDGGSGRKEAQLANRRTTMAFDVEKFLKS